MDLSNLRTSLREEEVSGQRRTAHLRAAEDELNAFFRSSALGLTTLYRQGVAATKASYEKGYAHALAHVLELWEKDRDWLKGYLQRRIEAIEAADAEDDVEEVQMDQPQPQQQPQQQQEQQAPSASTSFSRSHNHHTQTRPAHGATDSPRQSNKRSRNNFNDAAASGSHRDLDDSPVERRTLHRMPHTSAPASSAPFASSFNFSAPLAYPSSSSTTAAAATSAQSASSPTRPRPTRGSTAEGPVIKTSTPATSRRRLQKLKGLRAGRGDRIVEVEKSHDEEEMLPDGVTEDADAWTDDDDDEPSAKKGASGRKKVVVWAEKPANAGGAHAPQTAEGKVLERLDRRKRRRWQKEDDATMRDADSAETSREEAYSTDGYAYHS